jgi:tRNA(Ile)-lysidine synthase
MLMNLTKGTGIAGLHGIANKYEKVIRPLLCFNANEIDNYIKEKCVPYREDLSNTDTKYTRNLIRHQIIPELEKVNPEFIETLNLEANQFLNDEKIISDRIVGEKERLFINEDNRIKISIDELRKLNPLRSYLFYFLRDYGFNSSDVKDIISSFENQSGKIFYSKNYEIVKDREYLILSDIRENRHEKLEIKSMKDIPFHYEILEVSDDFKVKTSSEYACLDADKVQFPLTLRNWEQGDVFQPLGMKGNKKVSDFLINNKISINDKRSIKVLESDSQIIWIVGYRINDNFKVTSSTKKSLILSIQD